MANPTSLQLGAWNPATDAFVAHIASPTGAVIDLNDGVTFSLTEPQNGGTDLGEGFDWGVPDPVVITAGNLRTDGERVTQRVHAHNRPMKATLFAGAFANWAAFSAALDNLTALCEGVSNAQPAALRVKLTTASAYAYADVVEAHVSAKYREILYQQNLDDGIEVNFLCRPFFRGPQQYLQNLTANPGFESGAPAASVFWNDQLTNNLSGYDPQEYSDVVSVDTPLLWLPMDDANGSTAVNSGSLGTSSNGSYVGGPTLRQAGPLGGADLAVLFNGTSQGVTAPGTGLPSGNAIVSLEGLLKITGNPSATATVAQLGTNTTNNALMLQVNTSGQLLTKFAGGSAVTAAASLTLSTWHHVACTWDGTTLRAYVDGASVGTPITPGAASISLGSFAAGQLVGGGSYFPGTLDEIAVYGSTLSAARITAHYNASVIGVPSLTVPNTYVDVVSATTGGGVSLLRHYRFGLADDASHAYDIAGSNQTGTLHGNPTQAVSGLISGDTDTCYTFAAASSQYVTVPGTGLPSGNAAFSLLIWYKFASNPGSNQTILCYGASGTTNGAINLFIDTTGKLNLNTGSGGSSIADGAASTTAVAHLAIVTWNGTTVTMYRDGSSVGTASPASMVIAATPSVGIGANPNGPITFFSGQLDECALYSGALSGAQVTTLYNAGHSGATGNRAQTVTQPAGSRLQYGSSAWRAASQASNSFRYVTGLTATFYMHASSLNANLGFSVASGANGFKLFQTVGGVQHVLAQATVPLQHEAYYYWSWTQFPDSLGLNTVSAQPVVQVILYTIGNNGTTILSTLGPIFTFDGVTSVSGLSSYAAAGAALVTTVGNVSGFGPGGWQFIPQETFGGLSAYAAAAVGSIEQNTANTYPGPWQSYQAARVDLPLAGGVQCYWTSNANSSVDSGTGANAAPGATPGNTVQFVAHVKASGCVAALTLSLRAEEFDSGGSVLRRTTLASIAGNVPTSWTTLSGSLVVGASTAHVAILLYADDGGAGTSAGGTVWWDNCQCWDQTVTGATTMPYCEMRGQQSPLHVKVSGLLGDVPTPALAMIGTYYGSNFAPGASYNFIAGRRPVSSYGATLMDVPLGSYNGPAGSAGYLLVVDPTAWNGYYFKDLFSGPAYPVGINTRTLDQAAGIFHLWARGQTSETTFGKIQVSAFGAQSSGPYITGKQLGNFGSPIVYPFAAANIWQVFDLGYVPLPFGQLNSRSAQGSALYATVTALLYDPLGNTNGFVNWQALVPVDGSLIAGQVTSYAGVNQQTVPGGNWVWMYSDGLPTIEGQDAAWTFGATSVNHPATPAVSAPAPNNPNSTGPGGIGIVPTRENYLTLDPRLRLSPNSASGTPNVGANEIVLIVTDSTAAVKQAMLDLVYVPLYLYPQ